MIYKVKNFQCTEEHFFTSSEFCMYLVGLCDGGRYPKLHITSSRTKLNLTSKDNTDYPGFDYSVIIEFV